MVELVDTRDLKSLGLAVPVQARLRVPSHYINTLYKTKAHWSMAAVPFWLSNHRQPMGLLLYKVHDLFHTTGFVWQVFSCCLFFHLVQPNPQGGRLHGVGR